MNEYCWTRRFNENTIKYIYIYISYMYGCRAPYSFFHRYRFGRRKKKYNINFLARVWITEIEFLFSPMTAFYIPR